MIDKKLTIAMPSPGFFPNFGGAEIGLHNVSKRLKQRGHRPVVISSWKHVRALRKNGAVMPYEVIAYPPLCLGRYKKNSGLIQKILNMFYSFLQRHYAFDVAHINYAFPTGVSFIRWQKDCVQKTPFLIQSVGEDIQKQPEISYGMRLDPDIEALVQEWLPQAPMVTAVSESVYDEFKKLGITDDRIRMVSYGVDVKRFSSHVPTQTKEQLFSCSPDTFVFLCVGRNHPKKNFTQPLRALSRLLGEGYKNCLLVYVGHGHDVLQSTIDVLGIGDHVLLRKPPPLARNEYDNVPAAGLLDYYHHADCFLMPSITETFGIVIAEAMASGLPVIASDTPGCRDVTNHGEYALSYALTDDDALVAHMKTLIDQLDIRQHYCALSRQRVGIYDWDAITDQYLACYRALLS